MRFKPGDVLIPTADHWLKFSNERVTVLNVSDDEFEASWSGNPERIYTYSNDDVCWFTLTESSRVAKILENYGTV